MALSARLGDIPYIRLSKIERGEVVARASELQRIARVFDIASVDLLTDVTQPDFDMAIWAQPFQDGRASPDDDEERFAVMLAAALRVMRNADAGLTIARLDKEYGLPAVILSRLENAYKTLDRWNAGTVASLCRLFGVADEPALRSLVADRYRRGELDEYVARIADPEIRMARTREVIAALRDELSSTGPGVRRSVARLARAKSPGSPQRQAAKETAEFTRTLAVYGAPLPGGLIAFTATGASVLAPTGIGGQAFALRVCRATLGAGLPASAIVVIDPDRSPTLGSLVAIRSDEGYRLVTITSDRTGATKGYSVSPDLEFSIDDLDPTDVYAVVAAIFA